MLNFIDDKSVDTIFLISFIIAAFTNFILQIKIINNDAINLNKNNGEKEKEDYKQTKKRIAYYMLISFLIPIIIFSLLFFIKKLALFAITIIIIFSINNMKIIIKDLKEKKFNQNKNNEKIKNSIVNSQFLFWLFFSPESTFIIINELKNVIENIGFENVAQYQEILNLVYLTFKNIFLFFFIFSNVNIIFSNLCVLSKDRIKKEKSEKETFAYNINYDLVIFNDEKEHKILGKINNLNFYIKIPIYIIISTFKDLIKLPITKIKKIIINKTEKNESYITYKIFLRTTIFVIFLIYIHIKIGNYYETTKDLYETIFYSGILIYAAKEIKTTKNKED